MVPNTLQLSLRFMILYNSYWVHLRPSLHCTIYFQYKISFHFNMVTFNSCLKYTLWREQQKLYEAYELWTDCMSWSRSNIKVYYGNWSFYGQSLGLTCQPQLVPTSRSILYYCSVSALFKAIHSSERSCESSRPLPADSSAWSDTMLALEKDHRIIMYPSILSIFSHFIYLLRFSFSIFNFFPILNQYMFAVHSVYLPHVELVCNMTHFNSLATHNTF